MNPPHLRAIWLFQRAEELRRSQAEFSERIMESVAEHIRHPGQTMRGTVIDWWIQEARGGGNPWRPATGISLDELVSAPEDQLEMAMGEPE